MKSFLSLLSVTIFGILTPLSSFASTSFKVCEMHTAKKVATVAQIRNTVYLEVRVADIEAAEDVLIVTPWNRVAPKWNVLVPAIGGYQTAQASNATYALTVDSNPASDIRNIYVGKMMEVSEVLVLRSRANTPGTARILCAD